MRVLGLVCAFSLSLTAPLIAQAPAQEVRIDVGQLEARQKYARSLYALAPPGPILRVTLENLVPGKQYTLTLPPPASQTLSFRADLVPGDSGGHSCRALLKRPTGSLPKAHDERAVAAEVRALRSAIKDCNSDVADKVNKAIARYTTYTQPVNLTIKPDQEVQVSVVSGQQLHLPVTLTTCTPESQLEAYLRSRLSFSNNLRVLALDHRERTWSAYDWDGLKLSDLDSTLLEIGPTDNRAQLSLTGEKGEEAAVFVVNTDPLLYNLNSTSAAVADIPELANLQQLASSLGGFASVALSVAGARLADTRQLDKGITDALNFKSASAALQDTDVRKGVNFVKDFNILAMKDVKVVEVFQEIPGDPVDRIREAALNVPAVVWPEAVRFNAANQKFDPHAQALKSGLEKLDLQSSQAKSYLQAIELSGGGSSLTPPEPGDLLRNIGDSFAALQSAANELSKTRFTCVKSLRSLDEALAIQLNPLPVNITEQTKILQKYDNLLSNLSIDRVRVDNCNELTLSPTVSLDNLLSKIAEWLATNKPTTSEPRNEVRVVFDPVRLTLDGYLTEATGREDRLKKSGELLLKQGTVLAQAAGLQQFVNRRAAVLVPPAPRNPQEEHAALCSLRKGVIIVAPLAGAEIAPKWSSIHAENFTIKADPSLKKDIALDHPEEYEGKYAIRNRLGFWSSFDVSVGVVYTDIAERTWKAVAVNPDMAMQKQITRTKTESRAGELGMFANFHPWEISKDITWGPQFGVGLDTNHPSFFLGINGGWREMLRLSIGATTQRVSHLVGGQKEGDRIVEDNAIRTRNRFDTSYYVGLSLNIGGLPFFRQAEKK